MGLNEEFGSIADAIQGYVDSECRERLLNTFNGREGLYRTLWLDKHHKKGDRSRDGEKNNGFPIKDYISFLAWAETIMDRKDEDIKMVCDDSDRLFDMFCGMIEGSLAKGRNAQIIYLGDNDGSLKDLERLDKKYDRFEFARDEIGKFNHVKYQTKIIRENNLLELETSHDVLRRQKGISVEGRVYVNDNCRPNTTSTYFTNHWNNATGKIGEVRREYNERQTRGVFGWVRQRLGMVHLLDVE